MARILFVHNNFPGQFAFLVEAAQRRGHVCAAIASKTGRALGSVPLVAYRLERGTTPGLFGPATRAEADLIRAGAVAKAAQEMAEAGFVPDLVIGHAGWGETIFLRQVFPRACQILYGEFYYHPFGADTGFDPEFPKPTPEEAMRIHAKNATGLLAYADADAVVSPTRFQAGLFPAGVRSRMRVIHEGVECGRIAPAPPRPVLLRDGTRLVPGTPVVTFVNRRFEPLRGFHTFMRALPGLLARVPDARIVLIGADQGGGYGIAAGEGTWKARLLAELGERLDRTRLHFTGTLPNEEMHAILRVSAAHVYLTYPFVLSWSLLEAMALGCLVVGSRTAPVEEVVEHDRNGLLVDMLDPGALAATLADILARPSAAFDRLRSAARETIVARFDRRTICEPAWLDLIDEVLGAAAPA